MNKWEERVDESTSVIDTCELCEAEAFGDTFVKRSENKERK